MTAPDNDLFSLRLFSQAVRTKRAREGLSMRDLDARIGVSASTLSRIETETGAPDVETYLRLMSWLALPIPRLVPCPRCEGRGLIEE